MNDMHRRIMREVRRFAPGAKLEVIRARVHKIVKITVGQKTIQVTTSASPKNLDGAIFGTVREIRKKLNEPDQRA